MAATTEQSTTRAAKAWMNHFKKIRYFRFNSSTARALLTAVYRPGRPYRLWFGPLRGMKMYYDPSINFHAIRGLWDGEIFSLLNKIFVRGSLLPNDSVVADVGANIGYYTMWFATGVAAKGSVYAFEPSAETLTLLTNNLKLNDIRNAEVIACACGDHVGTADFFIAQHHHSSSLHEHWAAGGQSEAQKVTVPLTTLDAFFAPDTVRRPPSFIKMDIEGGGTFALRGCQCILREARPFVLIESHTPDEDRAISNVLIEYKYRGYRIDDGKWVKNPGNTHPDKEGVWGTLLLTPVERHASIVAAMAR
jgi:FkbM family methyltransferase